MTEETAKHLAETQTKAHANRQSIHMASRILLIAGIVFVTIALGLIVYNVADNTRASAEAGEVLSELQAQIPDEPPAASYSLVPQMEMPILTIDNYEYIGWIKIPALELALPVMSDWDNADLNRAPCRLSGSAYDDTLVIAGKSYASHFGKLADLREGDAVTFIDVDGNEFTYEVYSLEQIYSDNPDDISSDEASLTLTTQSFTGQYQLAVRCRTLSGDNA